MAKTRVHFVCRACGGVQAKWLGKCPDCGTWDALEKFVERPDAHAGMGGAGAGFGDDRHGGPVIEPGSDGSHGEATDFAAQAGRAQAIPDIPLDDVPRVATTIAEFDRVLGGGLVPGSVVLLGGDPGIGKSTLLLQALAGLAERSPAQRILYVSSEESARQVRLRWARLVGGGGEPEHSGSERMLVLAETNLARIVEQVRTLRPAVCAIDSIQMVYRGDLEAAPGSVAQLRRCCTDLVYLAKRSGMAVIVVGHVTKDGQLAGPKLLEHLVDVVLSFEGDRHHAYRVVRPVKNRFGSTQEIGLFEMTEGGLREVAEGSVRPDPDRPPPPGTAICPTMLGSRCLLAEIQALTATGILGATRRKASGIDANRLALLIAVLERHGGLRLADQDIFVSAAGGLRVVEPAADLALCLAIAGVHYGRRLSPGTAVIGEVDLTGRVRPVPQFDQRVREATRRGFRTVLVSPEHVEGPASDSHVTVVRTLAEALEQLGGERRRTDSRASQPQDGYPIKNRS